MTEHLYQMIFIPHVFTTLNEYINAERSSKYAAAEIKEGETAIAYHLSDQLMPVKEGVAVAITFTWKCKNKRSDPDNISFAKKFILDGLVQRGIIHDDGWHEIKSFRDYFEIDPISPGVEISITELDSE